jgi:hypothetical protein
MRGKATRRKTTRRTATPRKKRTPPRPAAAEDRGEIVELAGEVASHPETSPALTGGDVDADWRRAHMAGDEAVGGSVATPDQDVVDEIGHALGVEQAPDEEVRTSNEILRARDDLHWHLEREEADKEEGRPAPRRQRRPR